MAGLHLFALAAPRLAASIAARLGIDLGRHEFRPFEGGEHKIRPLDPVRGGDVYVWHPLHGDAELSVNDRLCHTWFFCAALRDHGAARITLLAPYLPYGRKDRRTQRFDPVTTRYVAQLCEAAGIDRVLTLDAHNPAAYENAFRHPAYNVEARPLLVAAVASALSDDDGPLVVLSPDAGGMKRAEAFREALSTRLGRDVDLGMMEKYRASGELSGSHLFAYVDGATVVVVDDLIARGSTLARTANAARERGARRILGVATHGLFAEDAAETLMPTPLEYLFVTDSITPPLPAAKTLSERIRVVSTEPLWAELVDRLHREQPLTDAGAP